MLILISAPGMGKIYFAINETAYGKRGCANFKQNDSWARQNRMDEANHYAGYEAHEVDYGK